METTTESGAGVPGESDSTDHDALFERISAEYTPPLARLARAHEADLALQQDLLQEIHIAIWRSLPAFGGRCALRTWVYRVAHNAAVSYVMRRQRGISKHLVSIDDFDAPAEERDVDIAVDEALMLARIHALLPKLKPIDREVFVLYLEGLTMEEIAEISGLSRTNTATKLHRQIAPADTGLLDTLRYQRRNLERQRDARHRSWRWWLPAALPGYGLMVVSQAVESGFRFELGLMVVWITAAMAGCVWAYERGARRLQREIDALDSLSG